MAGAGFPGGPPATGFVQQAVGESDGISVTLTFDSPTTPGNSVIVVVAGLPLRTITGIYLDTTGGLFSFFAPGPSGSIWTAFCVGDTADTVRIDTGSPGISATATEVSGPVPGVEWQDAAGYFAADVCTGTWTGPPLADVVEVVVG